MNQLIQKAPATHLNPGMNQNKGTSRITQLDGLRGIAILVVVLYHFVGLALQARGVGSLNLPEKVIMYTTLVGWCGVDLFFVLSGFLIGSILLRSRNSDNFFKTFYVRRFFRIVPICYALFILFILLRLTPIHHPTAEIFEKDRIPLFYYFLFIQNIGMGLYKTFGPLSIGVTWSLAVEEQFYLIIPLIIYYINPKYYKYVIAAGLLMAPISTLLLPNFYQHYTWLVCRINSPMIGFMIALLIQNEEFRSFVKRNLNWFFAASAILLIITALGHAYTTLGFINHSLSGINFGLILVIALSIEKGFWFRLLTSPFLLFMGKISYCFYLYHLTINGLLHLIILHKDIPVLDGFNAVMVTVLAFLLTAGLGVLSFKYIEDPLIRYSHRFKY